jgi:tetratricopeptide (TPR) repeat protein
VSDLAALAPIWQVTPHEGDILATALAVRDALQQQDTLLVLDNLDDPAVLSGPAKQVLPTHPCRMLVTTRCDHVPEMAELPLHNLTPADAVALLEASRDDAKDHRDVLERIAKALEYWALGVTLVAAYMQASTVSWGDYADDLEARGVESLRHLDGATRRTDSYRASVAELLDDVLSTLTTAEARFLEYVALLPADRAPVSWLQALLTADFERTDEAKLAAPVVGPGATVLGELRRGLERRQLVRVSQDGIELVGAHRLLADELTSRLHTTGAYEPRIRAVLAHATTRARYLFHHAIHDKEVRHELPVLQALLDELEDEGPFAKELASLASETSGGLKDLGDHAAARACRERAIRICEATLAADDPNLATSYSNLALVLHDEGKLEEARGYLDRAIAMNESALPPGHPNLARSYSNLALVLQDEGKLEEARGYLERAIAISESALPPGHPSLATRYSNLAMVLQDEGKLEEARGYLERAIAIEESALPPGHPSLATSYSNLALVLHAEGKLEEARGYLERAIAIQESALPAGHPNLATRYLNLGAVLSAQGKPSDGRDWYERAWTIVESRLPPTHWVYRAVASRLGKTSVEGD